MRAFFSNMILCRDKKHRLARKNVKFCKNFFTAYALVFGIRTKTKPTLLASAIKNTNTGHVFHVSSPLYLCTYLSIYSLVRKKYWKRIAIRLFPMHFSLCQWVQSLSPSEYYLASFVFALFRPSSLLGMFEKCVWTSLKKSST